MIRDIRIARDLGKTTKQMMEAPEYAVFVWCNTHLSYALRLARRIGRSDLEVVSPSWIDGPCWRGRKLSGVVVDHATRLTGRQFDALEYEIKPRIGT